MSELHVRSGGVGGDGAGVVELEHGFVRGRRDGADGRLGEEEGDEVSERFRGQVSEEAVLHVAWDMVGMECGGARLRLRLWTGRAQSEGQFVEKIQDLTARCYCLRGGLESHIIRKAITRSDVKTMMVPLASE